MRQVPFVGFPAQYAAERSEILACVEEVFGRGDFVGGAAVEALEGDLAAFLGRRHVVGLNSGTDALILGLRALGLGPGDEVIVPPNSFVASAAAVAAVGAVPVFADVRDDLNLDPAAAAAAVTPRTRAVMPVHLTGRVADMDPILDLARRHGLAVIEDAAQAIGSRYRDRQAGTFGDVAAFSAHPLKNLNAAGDAGFLVTDDDALARRVRLWRNHGLVDRDTVETWGTVSRLDTLQAAILRPRLKKLPEVIGRRRANVAAYRNLVDTPAVRLPVCRDHEFNTFHLLIAECGQRDALRTHLAARGIGTAVHYPIPLHLQPAARGLGYRPGILPVAEAQAGRIVSLPVHQFLDAGDIAWVAEALNAFDPEREAP